MIRYFFWSFPHGSQRMSIAIFLWKQCHDYLFTRLLAINPWPGEPTWAMNIWKLGIETCNQYDLNIDQYIISLFSANHLKSVMWHVTLKKSNALFEIILWLFFEKNVKKSIFLNILKMYITEKEQTSLKI